MKNKYFWPLVIVGSLIGGIILNSGSASYNFFTILGSATGFILFPAIIALIISGLMRLTKKKLSDEKFNDVFLILWGAMLVFFILGNFLI